MTSRLALLLIVFMLVCPMAAHADDPSDYWSTSTAAAATAAAKVDWSAVDAANVQLRKDACERRRRPGEDCSEVGDPAKRKARLAREAVAQEAAEAATKASDRADEAAHPQQTRVLLSTDICHAKDLRQIGHSANKSFGKHLRGFGYADIRENGAVALYEANELERPARARLKELHLAPIGCSTKIMRHEMHCEYEPDSDDCRDRDPAPAATVQHTPIPEID